MPPLPRTVFTDRTGLLGATGSLLAGLPPALAGAYLLTRLLIPVLLIVLAGRRATPAERIGLVRDYLIGRPTDPTTTSPTTSTSASTSASTLPGARAPW